LDLAQKGKQKRTELQQQLEAITKQKENADIVKAEKEALKNAAEELEKAALEKHKALEDEQKRVDDESNQAEKDKVDAADAFTDLDVNQDGKITVDELQSKWVFDTDKDGIVTEEEAKFYLAGKSEYTLETFLDFGWVIVKPHYSMMKLFKPPQADELQPDSPDDSSYTDKEPVEQTTPGLPPPPEVEEEERKDDEIDDEDENAEYDPDAAKEEEPKSMYDPETQQVVDDAKAARSDFEAANKEVMDLDRELRDTKAILDIEFGEDDQFAPYHGQCFEYTDREYTYKLCMFDAVTQRPKSGGSDVNLGRWGHWSGSEENKFSHMKYENGLSCWNGPTRSTEVKLSCGVENQVISVSEPNRCIYIMEFETPAVCVRSADGTDHMHEEL